MAGNVGTTGIIPFWLRRIKKPPHYWKGNPQYRVFMPQFWMKMKKPEYPVPPSYVMFQVHPQMTKFDIKNYLQKIYQVPVSKVRTEVREGEKVKHGTLGYVAAKEADIKLAYVQLANGATFEFPDIFGEKLPSEAQIEEVTKSNKENLKQRKKHWDKLDIPPWFR